MADEDGYRSDGSDVSTDTVNYGVDYGSEIEFPGLQYNKDEPGQPGPGPVELGPGEPGPG
jgi:hypothetical protein